MSIKIKTNLDFLSVARIMGLPTPTSATEAATKAYVDALIEGNKWKTSARAATTDNVILASELEAGDVIDGVSLQQGDRVLVKDQTTQSENGIYLVEASGAPTRALDANTATELEAAVISIEEGTVNRHTTWRQIEVNFTLGISNITFDIFGTASPPASETIPGIAEIATQTEVDIGTDTNRFITPATFAGSARVIKRHAETIGDGSSNQFTVTHNFGTEDINVEIREAAGNKQVVLADWRITSVNSIRIDFISAPALGEYRVVVIS